MSNEIATAWRAYARQHGISEPAAEAALGYYEATKGTSFKTHEAALANTAGFGRSQHWPPAHVDAMVAFVSAANTGRLYTDGSLASDAPKQAAPPTREAPRRYEPKQAPQLTVEQQRAAATVEAIQEVIRTQPQRYFTSRHLQAELLNANAVLLGETDADRSAQAARYGAVADVRAVDEVTHYAHELQDLMKTPEGNAVYWDRARDPEIDAAHRIGFAHAEAADSAADAPTPAPAASDTGGNGDA